MELTPAQLKGRLKNLAKQHNADARTLMRLYMMERFLERISLSRYNDLTSRKLIHTLGKSLSNP